MSTASDRNRDDAPLGKKLEDLYDLIEGMEIAMFTTAQRHLSAEDVDRADR